MLVKIITILIRILKALRYFLTKKEANIEILKSFGTGSLYPYDIVIEKQIYEKLITQQLNQAQTDKPLFGVVTGIISVEKDETTKAIFPSKVEVSYFNCFDYKFALTKEVKSEDLYIILPTMLEIEKKTSLIKDVGNIIDYLLEEDPENSESQEDSEDSEDPDGGEIIH